ncbi:hypothetical protein M5689_022369 [Euphorbia peplus]|nr:hypothetical protein M5689_022369 [Euphorbia peplus]
MGDLPASYTRAYRNRVRVLEESRMKGQVLKKSPVPQTVIKNNFSVDSSCSSDTNSNSFSSSSSSLKVATPRRTVKPNVFRTVKVLPHISQDQDVPVKRCDWITPNSDADSCRSFLTCKSMIQCLKLAVD